MNTETTEKSTLTEADYSRAMNLIGQNLYNSLSESFKELQPELRSHEVITQAMAAFTANVLYRQSSQDKELRQNMFAKLNELIGLHLANMP